jgi:hypothetical protein
VLVTFEEIKDALRVSTNADDVLLDTMLTNVHIVLLDYLGHEDLDAYLYATVGMVTDELYYEYGEDWPTLAQLTPVTVLRTSVFVSMAHIYDNRADSPLTEAVKSILRRFRMPVVSDANAE